MLAYKPKEEPALTKMVKSGLFQFMMVVFLGVGVTYFVIRTDQPQQWIQRINRFASVTPNTNAKTATEAGIAEDQAEFEAPPPQANTWAARAGSGTEMTQTMAAETSPSNSAASSTFAAASVSESRVVSAPIKLRVQMVEIDQNYLNSAVNENENGTVSSGNDGTTIFKSNRNFKIDSSNFRILKNDVLDFANRADLSTKAGNSSRWIELSASLTRINGELDFDMSFNKNHPSDTHKIPVRVLLNTGEKIIISGPGLLSYFDNEAELVNVAPFTIFKSPDFSNQKTTFAIIIELQ